MCTKSASMLQADFLAVYISAISATLSMSWSLTPIPPLEAVKLPDLGTQLPSSQAKGGRRGGGGWWGGACFLTHTVNSSMCILHCTMYILQQLGGILSCF